MLSPSPRYWLTIGIGARIPIWNDEDLCQRMDDDAWEWISEDDFRTVYSTPNGTFIVVTDNAEAFWGVE